jgi:hypothetical protein
LTSICERAPSSKRTSTHTRLVETFERIGTLQVRWCSKITTMSTSCMASKQDAGVLLLDCGSQGVQGMLRVRALERLSEPSMKNKTSRRFQFSFRSVKSVVQRAVAIFRGHRARAGMRCHFGHMPRFRSFTCMESDHAPRQMHHESASQRRGMDLRS